MLRYATQKQRAKVNLNICWETFFRPVLEDKLEKFKWKILVGIVEVSNVVVREHMKFIKDSLMEKYDDFLE